MFAILEAGDFPKADVDMFRRTYAGSFLVMANKFGISAACVLFRGIMQGAEPSPKSYITVMNPIHVL